MLKTSHQKINDCTMFLFNLVFKPHEVYRILTLAPDIVNTEISQLDNNIKLLRKLGIQDGTLQKTIASCPTILIVKTKQFKLILKTLKERCQFSKEQVCKIIQTCPTVVHEDAYKMEVKFQYVYFTMGIQDPKSQVIARVFKHNLFHIRKRHEFLERMGLYERPDKKGMTQIENPSLKQIIDTTNERFAVKIAKSSVEDFQAFSNVFVNEVYHADRNSDYDSDDYDSDIYNNVYDNTNI
ncbi:transcription termination factor 4, mitochondrial-like [Saccoglossus kowalevskii]